MSLFKRKPKPEQQTWIALQDRLRRTLVTRLASGERPVMGEQDADDLADHLADDLMSLDPTVPPAKWVSQEGGTRPSRG